MYTRSVGTTASKVFEVLDLVSGYYLQPWLVRSSSTAMQLYICTALPLYSLNNQGDSRSGEECGSDDEEVEPEGEEPPHTDGKGWANSNPCDDFYHYTE